MTDLTQNAPILGSPAFVEEDGKFLHNQRLGKVVELKASHKRLEHAYQHNLRDYKGTIPHLFWYNAFIILSNGSQSRIGSTTAAWEHFAEWKKINSATVKARRASSPWRP